MISQYRQHKWLEVCKEIERDKGKTYWTKIKKLTKYKTTNRTNSIFDENGSELTTDQDKANEFAKHYQNAFKVSTNIKFDEDNWTKVNNWYNNCYNKKFDHDIPYEQQNFR